MWRLITHWFDFPSVKRGYRTSHEVAEFLSQKNIFIEFNERLQTGESFRLIETHSSKAWESRFSFLTSRKLPAPQPIALMGNDELPVQERPKRERTAAAEDIEIELAPPQDTKRFNH